MQRTRGSHPRVLNNGSVPQNVPGCNSQASLRSAWEHTNTIVSNPGNPASWDRYSYVENRPINHFDPSGHSSAATCRLYQDGECVVLRSKPIYIFENPWEWDLDHDGFLSDKEEDRYLRMQAKAERMFQAYMKSPLKDKHYFYKYLDACTTSICGGMHPGVDSSNYDYQGRPIYSTAYGVVVRVGYGGVWQLCGG